MSHAGHRLGTVWRWLAGAAAALALLVVAGVAAFALAIQLLPGYQQRVADEIRAATGLRLQFDSLNARIGRYGPEIHFRGARVWPASGAEPLVSAASGSVSLAIGRSLWRRRFEVGRVVLVRPRLHFVIRPDGAVELVGQGAVEPAPGAGPRPLTLARLPRGLLAIRDATLKVLDLRSRQDRFELTGVHLEIERLDDRVRLHGNVELPEHLGSAVAFDADAAGDLEQNATIAWRARIEGRGLDFEQWAALLPDSFRVPAAGHGAIRATARGTGERLVSLRLRMQLAGLRLPGADAGFTRVAGDLRWQRDGTGLSIDASGLELSREGAPWKPTSLALRLTQREGRIASAALRADYLRIENLAVLAALLPAGPARERIRTLAPRGELFGVDVVVADAGRGRPPDFSGRARFADIGMEAHGNVPGIGGLDGAIEGRGAGGVVHLDTRDGLVSWPPQWRALADLPSVSGRLEWSRFEDGLRLWLDEGGIDTGHGKMHGRLRMLLRPGMSPLLDLNASVTDFDATQLWRYLPIGRLKAKSLGWLDAAFRAGKIVDGTVSITGPARGFPYRDGQGNFQAEARLAGTTLYYARGWPEIHGIEARVAFSGPGMRAMLTRGVAAGVALTQAEAHIADLREAILVVRGSVRGDAGSAIRLLQDSPVGPSLGAGFGGLKGAGPLTAELALFLPIRDFDRRVITVMTSLAGATLRHGEQPLAIQDLRGDLWVRNREIDAPALTGQLLGGPFRAAIGTRRRQDGDLDTEVQAQGTLSAAALAPVARLPLNAGLTGHADWRGFLTIGRSADRQAPARGTLRISSDLRGLGSKLPEPFAKSADAARPLTIHVDYGAGAGPRIRVQLGRDIHALLQWRGRPEDPAVERGILFFGAAAPGALPREAGLWLAGRLEAASLTDLLAMKWGEPRGRPLHEWLAGADLTIRRFEVLGFGFDAVSGRMRPGNRAWAVDIEAAAAGGHVVVPYRFPGEVPLALDFERLHFGDRVRGGAGEPDPRRLPAIRVDVRDLLFDGRRYGHVQAELARGTNGLTLNQFTMQHAAFAVAGRGSWLTGATGAQSRLEFEIDSDDVPGFMDAMRLGTLVTGRRGHLRANLSWSGAPEANAIERLSGRLEMAAEDGRLTSVEPGAGRVLGLMSLAHLPRRLALDFGDLTGEGLAFDTLRGSFQLNDGDAYTDNLMLRGPAAEIGLAGHTSLKDRTYDQTAVVTGRLGASLGVAGTLAGGPAVGAALLLFSKVFKERLAGATRGYYRITGSWEDPQVRRIDAREMKDGQQATAPAGAGLSVGVPESR